MKSFVVFLSFYLLNHIYAEDVEDSTEKGPIHYTAKDFDENIAKNPHFIMFYAPWCGHCKRLHPTWEQLADKYNIQDPRTVTIGKVDCTTDTSVCSSHEVNGYPTLKIYGKGSLEGIKYKGTRELASFEKFIADQLDLDIDSDSDLEPQPSSKLIEFNEESFESTVKKGNHFVKFYAPWCGHCQKLAPTWSNLAQTFEYDNRVTIGMLDCTKHRTICTDHKVNGYPTLLWIEDGNIKEKYSGARTLDDLKKFVVSQLSSKENESEDEKDQPTLNESPVATLTSLNFENAISSGITLVKFFAPWCGHCKRLAPTYEELGKEFMADGLVTIAKVDCTLDLNKELCSEQKITGFPTLHLYKDGKQVEQYRGDRSLKDLASFVTSKVPHEEL